MIVQLLLVIAKLDFIISVAFTYTIVVFGWWFIRQVAMDAIGIYQSWQIAKADKVKRLQDDEFEQLSKRVKLQVWQRQAKQQLTQQRTALQLGSEAMWKMGIFDVEIEENDQKHLQSQG